MHFFPRRAWFRFSLRSLFVLVTLVCVWLGYQMSIVRERQELRRSIVGRGGEIVDIDPSAARMPDIEDVPWYRRLLGDRAAASIHMKCMAPTQEISRAEVQRVMRSFSEAEMWKTDASGMTWYRGRDFTGKLFLILKESGQQ